MQKIIYTTKFFCRFCKKEIPVSVYGDMGSTFPESDQEKEEALEWGKHYHWIDNHRRCAICGEKVISGKQDEPEGLNLLVNEGQVQIHSRYEAETMENAHGAQLLIVHNKCMVTPIPPG